MAIVNFYTAYYEAEAEWDKLCEQYRKLEKKKNADPKELKALAKKAREAGKIMMHRRSFIVPETEFF